MNLKDCVRVGLRVGAGLMVAASVLGCEAQQDHAFYLTVNVGTIFDAQGNPVDNINILDVSNRTGEDQVAILTVNGGVYYWEIDSETPQGGNIPIPSGWADMPGVTVVVTMDDGSCVTNEVVNAQASVQGNGSTRHVRCIPNN